MSRSHLKEYRQTINAMYVQYINSLPCLAIRRIGLTSSGTQRYKCNACSKSFTGTQVGRPCLMDKPLTNYESVKRDPAKRYLNDL